MKYGLAVAFVFCMTVGASAAAWQQSQNYRDKMGAELTITATYYGAAEVNRQVTEATNKNLWTADEAEKFRYNLLTQLKLDEYIPIHIAFDNMGPALRMSPFGAQVELLVGKEHLQAADYDKRFNFKVTDKIDGFVYFPRFDRKGKPYLTPKVKTVTLVINGSGVAPVIFSKDVRFVWDVRDDHSQDLLAGKAGAKLEIDRLLKRLDLLNTQGQSLQTQLTSVQQEMKVVNDRIMELQKQE